MEEGWKRNQRLASITLSMFGLGAALLARPESLFADESGVSFWIPGFFGNLAATPSVPGWSWATVYYHTDVSSGAGAAFPRGGRVDLEVRLTGV